jgi:DNA segregation ATPase FtsK/SpoIIIE, S-DNA-T family
VPGSGRAGVAVSRSATPRTRDERLPPLSLLQPDQPASPMDEEQIHATAALLEQTLAEYNIPARVVGFRVGPTVTQFAVEPGYLEKIGPDGTPVRQKIRVSQISALSRDLALALSAERLRIEAPVPGQSFVGIEVPNQRSSPVYLRSLLEGDVYRKMDSPLSVALGRDVSGQPVIADLARAPHMLIAGTTGSGKSVCITALTACLVLNNSPAELRIAMLDPKMVELVRYNGLPHLFGKVETEIDRMLGVLRWALAEMDRRYRLLEEARARDLDAYNLKQRRKKLPILPRIVVLVDELADLMMSAPEQTENSIVRLAQMARATGIHLVVATQRPSTDVVTGLIKANFPFRISFTVASAVDSRVILDVNGAESLLGRGDMLVLNPEVGTPQRAQGVLVTDAEIERVVQFWQKTIPPVEDNSGAPWEGLVEEEGDDADELVQQAITIVRRSQKASASMLQRRLHIGYPRAAHLMDELEELGVVGPSAGGGREREVLLPPPGNGSDEEGDEEMDDES